MEKYSVLMSVYAKEKPDYLRLAINSMISQTIQPDEIIIVEDGPLNSELYDVINEFKKNYEFLFTIVINEKNLGLGLALNNGLSIARNDLVARMDTDDISKPDRCEKQLKIFEQDSTLSIVGSWVDEFSISPDDVVSIRKVPEKNNEIYSFAKRRNAFNHPSVMYRKHSIIDLGGYSDLKRAQDLDLFGRMLFKGYKAYNIQESLLLFRISDNGTKRKKSWAGTKNYIKIIKNFWKMGYSSFFDYIYVFFIQIMVFCLPIRVQKFITRKFLRG